MRAKYKTLRFSTLCLVLICSVAMATFVSSPKTIVNAQAPVCSGGAKIVRVNGKPMGCECPKGKKMVVNGNSESCVNAKASCPSGTKSAKNPNGSTFCAAPTATSVDCGTDANGNSLPPAPTKAQCASSNASVSDDPAASSTRCADASNCDLVTKYVKPVIQFLSALVGLAVVISIVIGGIQYASSAGDPQAASAAKNRIRNAILALIVFLFLYALLNFLLPGGLIS